MSITVALLLAGLAAWAVPTIAADQSVHAVGAIDGDYGTAPDHFEPATVRVAPGESVTFVNDAGTHNVKFVDGQFTSPAVPSPPAAWPAPPSKRTFPQAGTYRFYCEMHGAPDGMGMSGRVVVGSETPPTPPGGPRPGAPPASPGALKIVSLSLPGRRFCNRRGRRCRRPGVRLAIDLSKPGRVTGTLTRRPLEGRRRAREFGTLDFGTVEAGSRRLRFTRTRSGRRLTRGRYALTIRAGQNTRVLRFSVVS